MSVCACVRVSVQCLCVHVSFRVLCKFSCGVFCVLCVCVVCVSVICVYVSIHVSVPVFV